MSLLKITLKQQTLFPQISKIIIQKLIEIDAEIKLDTNQMLGDDNLTSEEKMSFVDSMARKLDWLMLIFFEYLSVHFGNDKEQELTKNNLFFTGNYKQLP